MIREDDLYVSISLYGRQLAKFLSSFDRDRCVILRVEDVVHSPVATMDKAWRFLDVEPLDDLQLGIHNVSDNREQRDPNQFLFTQENYDYLLDRFVRDLAERRQATGFSKEDWDLSAGRWLQR